MKRYVIGGAALLLLVASMFGASAFTSAEITRDATIGVSADNQSVIALEPGPNVGDSVTIGSNGALQIDAAPGTSGINVESTFEYGDNASPTTDSAFKITNADSQVNDLTLSYENIANNQGVPDTVNFEVYDASGVHLGTVSPSNDLTTTVNSGDTVYVVMEVDTTGLDDGADLSGDFVIRV